MIEPYSDRAGYTGVNVTDMERIREIARISMEHGYQVAVHAIGDRANRETLDLFAALFDSAGVDGDTLRWRVEHAQHLRPEDIPRFGEMGVVASMQAMHACSDAPYNYKRLGAERVRFPGLANHPGHELARRQQERFGGLLAFDLPGGRDDAFRFINALKIPSITANLGDTKTTVTHPASTTHARVSDAERAAGGITEGLVRISAGLESAADLEADLGQALQVVRG